MCSIAQQEGRWKNTIKETKKENVSGCGSIVSNYLGFFTIGTADVLWTAIILGELRWRTAKMWWSLESPPELVGELQRCLFQRDFVCSVLFASRLMPIVCKQSSVTASCLS